MDLVLEVLTVDTMGFDGWLDFRVRFDLDDDDADMMFDCAVNGAVLYLADLAASNGDLL